MPRFKWPRFYRPVRPDIHTYSLHVVNKSRLAGARPVFPLEQNDVFLAVRIEAQHGRRKPVVRSPGLEGCAPDAQAGLAKRLAASGCQQGGDGLEDRAEATRRPFGHARHKSDYIVASFFKRVFTPPI
jgi:hypothetical protein